MPSASIGVALVGTGQVALQNHLPGLMLSPDVRLVALCDTNPDVLARAGQQTGVRKLFADWRIAVQDEEVSAVIIATPNVFHPPIALEAIAAGRHVMCEKPLALTYADARAMHDAAERAGVRHMTAFTYRFVPAMRYMRHLVQSGAVGEPLHFRALRLQDWGRRHLAWRQQKSLAGSGELGDMLSHRIDYAHSMMGPIARVVARTKQVWDTRVDANGVEHPSDLEDWVACLADFETGATGVLESSKLATGRGEGGRSPDICEVNGTEGSLLFSLDRPHELRVATSNAEMRTVAVPNEFLKVPGSPRDAASGDPLQNFRYDQSVEFVQAIREERPCSPSFADGARAQAVMDAILRSAEMGKGVEVER